MRALFLGLIAVTAPASAAAQRDERPERLQAEIARIAAESRGAVGVGIRHLESGREVYLDGDRAFLMGSTYKVPIAVQLLTLVDRGKERLDRRVPLLAGDLFPSGSLLSERFRDPKDPGVSLALVRYLELMLTLSDNAATDVILREIGGPVAVTARIRQLGIRDLRVDRTVMQIYQEYSGMGPLAPEERNLDGFFRALSRITPEEARAAQRAYHAAPEDRSTPRAMVELLTRIWRRQALADSTTDRLLAIMSRDETGTGRLRGRLPVGTRVASKTGTYGTVVVNDVGIVDLPDGAGHFAIAVFTEDERSTEAAKERIIADVARAGYDYFRFVPPAR